MRQNFLSCPIDPLHLHRTIPRWFWLPATLLLGLRFLHLGPELDDPHMWRQADTAYYIWDFYQNGVDFLHPSVCWVGAHKTVVLEFPLPEALVAWTYQLLGPHLVWARLIFLAFYVAAAWYFLKVVRHLMGAEVASLATLVYLALPLGLYYSRAVHFDFMVVFLGHAMLYHFMLAMDRASWRQMALSMAMAALGFMVKAPTIFYLGLPALYYVWRDGQWRTLLRLGAWVAVPIAAFLAWQWHATRVNAAMPDWSFIPDYHKMDKMSGWYFGTLGARMEWPLWQQVWGRLKFELAGVVGLPLLVLGGLLGLADRTARPMVWWAVGTLAYLLIFFTLNFHHDYYQIPFLAPVAFFIALPLHRLYQWLSARNRVVAKLATLGLFWVLGLQCIRLSEGLSLSEDERVYFGNYYQPSPLAQDAGALIRAHTPEDAVVISTFGGLDARCPLVLYHARRPGWSVGKQLLTVELLQRIQALGATHFALLQVEPMSPELEAYVGRFPMERHFLPGGHWPLRIYDLRLPK